jgi:hypothetical protein
MDTNSPKTKPDSQQSPLLKANVGYIPVFGHSIPGVLTLSGNALTFVEHTSLGTINLPLNLIQNAYQIITMLNFKVGGKWYQFDFGPPDALTDSLKSTAMTASVAAGANSGLARVGAGVIATAEGEEQITLEEATNINQFVSTLRATGLPAIQFRGLKSYTSKNIRRQNTFLQVFSMVMIGIVLLVFILVIAATIYGRSS